MNSLPKAFVKRMKVSLGEDANIFFESLEQDAVSAIRTNPFKRFIPEGLMQIPWCKEGYYLFERPSFVADPLFHAGAYYVQEAASMILAQMVDMRPNMCILDLCGAPGGKSTLLASYMKEGSFLVANEVIHSRAKILAENLTRWGNPHTIVTQNDPANFSKYLSDYFDLILVDAPCSGEGMFRKEPASRSEWSEEAVWHCSARQKRILADIVSTLAPKGQLIYSTCTYSKAENEDIIHWLLSEFEKLELYPKEGLKQFGAESIEINNTPDAAYRCMPHKMRGEGLFICRMRKKETEILANPTSQAAKKRKKQRSNQQKNARYQTLILDFLSTFLNDTTYQYSVLDDLLLIQSAHLQNFPFSKFKTLKKGLLTGKIHRKGINPTHELALSSIIAETFPSVLLSEEEAKDYLQKKDIQLASALPISHGWLLAKYANVNLGWLKVVNGRLKNHYPINWRIRKSLSSK